MLRLHYANELLRTLSYRIPWLARIRSSPVKKHTFWDTGTESVAIVVTCPETGRAPMPRTRCEPDHFAGFAATASISTKAPPPTSAAICSVVLAGLFG